MISELRGLASRPVRLMEVCGTHTVSIFRHGLRSLLPPEIVLISGPGCPVCVTPAGEIDAFVSLAKRPGITVVTFGDLVRVPGSGGSLAEARARGARIEVVYSPIDALQIARQRPGDTVVFLGVGFETTAPTVAATMIEARRQNLGNFTLFAAHKTVPPALDGLLGDGEVALDGLICPGHVSTVLGASAYRPLVEKYRMPCVVAGFEPVDILAAILQLARQVIEGEARVMNAYPRAVRWGGNERARAVMDEVFEQADSEWRGLGTIPKSGLALRPEWADLDAVCRLDVAVQSAAEPEGCMCGEVLKGLVTPPDCPLFAHGCTPLAPVGPCMVSSEGTCAAHFRYGDRR